MVAVDTSVVVRLLTHDDRAQASRALALFRSEEIWIGKTVVLETEWVLRSLYGFSGERVREALRAMAGLRNVHLEDAATVAQALSWAATGLDFADALHLASSVEAETFVSFDEKFVKRAVRAGVVRVRVL